MAVNAHVGQPALRGHLILDIWDEMCLVLVGHLTDRDLKLIAVLQDHDFEIKLFILNLYNMVIFTKKLSQVDVDNWKQ